MKNNSSQKSINLYEFIGKTTDRAKLYEGHNSREV